MSESAIRNAVKQTGGRGKLAVACGVRYQAVQKWEIAGVPLERCAAIEAATLGKVRCEDLRPDVHWQRDAAGRVIGYLVSLEGASAPQTDVQEAA